MTFKVGDLVRMRKLTGIKEYQYGLTITRNPFTIYRENFHRDKTGGQVISVYDAEVMEVVIVLNACVVVWVPQHNGYDWFPMFALVPADDC